MNKQITEDYCSFEVAKLLKEKGVDFIDCVTYYCEDKPKDVNYSFCGETNSTWEKRCCQAPTHQMTLKYLRKVHNIIIVTYPVVTDDDGECGCLWGYIIRKRLDSIHENDEVYYKPEDATEEAILYVLKNLI